MPEREVASTWRGAIVRRFAPEGYAMAVVRRSADRLVQLADQITALGGTALPLAVDARGEEQVTGMFARVVAETYWHLHGQPRDAWTHEVDLRPWIEKW